MISQPLKLHIFRDGGRCNSPWYLMDIPSGRVVNVADPGGELEELSLKPNGGVIFYRTKADARAVLKHFGLKEYRP